MTDISNQKRMAADVLDVGEGRVWIDPDRVDDVDGAITKQDIRNLIESGVIKKKQKDGTSRQETEKDKGPGSRKGHAGARKSDKDKWKEKIRALRKDLKEMREEGEISSSEYRELYDMASGGYFRNTKHMELYIEKNLGE
ncbi:MAG: 50S ribosomal protein L19e [Candidatus Nanohaloarchaeota archaeon QJJ-7]|nr:50S ribosomal protein L19e [Candidatus Nanohaloarchaeota archaeon QJJ-7]